MWIGREYCYESIFAVIIPKHQMQDDGSEEEYVNEELDPPPKGASVKEEAISSDEEAYVNDDINPPKGTSVKEEAISSDEDCYVNDDIGRPEKVHCSVH